jgi:acetyl-CoA C-acetyltransferase
MLSPYDIRNGLGMPTQTYPAIEHALRARWGLSRFDHVRLMSELWAGFSQVAVANPHSQFPAARDVDFLSTPSAANYPLADPYLKWHVAQDAVNQSGALILTSVGEAQRIGIASEKLIYLHGYAAAKDRPVTQRPDLSRSMPVERALQSALTGAGKTPDDIALFDIYSCFPCVVLIACEALGVDWRTRDMTVTGGLPFFGGPGNSYSLHAIATMTEKLRARPDAFGLILANSGFMSKEAVGVYSATPRANWQPQSSAAIQAEIDARPMPQLVTGDTVITIETYTVTWRGGVPDRAFVIGSCAEGRVLARVDKSFPGIAAKLAACDPIGRRARIAEMDGANIIADILS